MQSPEDFKVELQQRYKNIMDKKYNSTFTSMQQSIKRIEKYQGIAARGPVREMHTAVTVTEDSGKKKKK